MPVLEMLPAGGSINRREDTAQNSVCSGSHVELVWVVNFESLDRGRLGCKSVSFMIWLYLLELVAFK